MKTPPILDHLHYIAKRTFKGHALYIALSHISDDKIRNEITSLLKAYENTSGAIVFEIGLADKVAFFNNNKAHHMMLMALKMKNVIGAPSYEKIIQSYDLKSSFSLLYNRIYNLVLTPQTDQLHHLSIMQKIPHKAFTLNELRKALTHLSETSLTHLIRHQPVIHMGAPMTVLFTSHFVRLSDIRRSLIPDVDIGDNMAFYTALREAVQLKVFQKLSAAPLAGSINMPLQLFRESFFQSWINTLNVLQKQKITFEVAFDDYIFHTADYQKIYDQLKPLGFHFVLRFHHIPDALKLEHLPADYIKVPARHLISRPYEGNPLLNDMIAMGVDDEKMADALMQKGIDHLQGFFTTNLMNAKG